MNSPFTFEEANLLCICKGDTKQETMSSLRQMRPYLDDEDRELRELTDSVLKKLADLSEEEYGCLEHYPDF